ncbi:MAG: triose-phosphate isomerase, partial [Defluviitaleaceae bacterium]|nr:triose-phosphate isomerase [Defluviitaleaceae bacterium]
MRKKIIAGNWKMNFGVKQATDFINEIKSKIDNGKVDTIFCVPFTDIGAVVKLLEGTNIKVGAQNC